MKNLATDISSFIKSLTLNDYIFFGAILALIILGVVVIYLIKATRLEEMEERTNRKEILEDAITSKNPVKEEIKEVDNGIPEVNKIISNEELLGLKSDSKEVEDVLPPVDDEEAPLIDLATLTKILENNETTEIDMTKYEQEEEEKAIISYEELVKSNNAVKINYEEEKNDDGLMVKKIDLGNLTTVTENESEKDNKISTKTISYEKEEAFLKALKDLQRTLS